MPKLAPLSSAYEFAPYANGEDFAARNGGQQAPLFDPKLPPKYWADPAGRGSYLVIDGSGPATRTMALPAAQASAVNLPGPRYYAPYVIAPTPAAYQFGAIDPRRLCTEDEARAIMAEVGGVALFILGNMGQYPIDWGGDLRRQYMFTRGGLKYYAGELIAQKHQCGVGAPGQWITRDGQTVWEPDPRVLGGSSSLWRNDLEPVPTPLKLAPDQKIVAVSFGPGFGELRVRTGPDDPPEQTAVGNVAALEAKIDQMSGELREMRQLLELIAGVVPV